MVSSGCKLILQHMHICRFKGHDDAIKWKPFPRYWSFVRGIHRLPVNSPHKGQWRGALMFSLICVWINGWVNNCEADDLRRYPAHYDVTVMDVRSNSFQSPFDMNAIPLHLFTESSVNASVTVCLKHSKAQLLGYCVWGLALECLLKIPWLFSQIRRPTPNIMRCGDQYVCIFCFQQCGILYHK